MYLFNLGIRFQETAERCAEKTALWFAERDVTSYSDLNRLSNQTARWMFELGVRRGDVVCLSGEKSTLTFALMIACLKIGAIYCILDPESPAERLRKIVSTCQPKLLIGEGLFLDKAETVSTELGVLIQEKEVGLRTLVKTFDDKNLLQTYSVTGADAAYIMFTSGSTGFPKGAVMTHANVLNLINWSQETYSLTTRDVLTNVNPLYFDNSVFDFYSALFTGAQLVPFSKAEVGDPAALVRKVDSARCTLWFSVPSLLIFLQTMRATDGKNLRSIQRFVFGGEGFPKGKLKALYDSYSDSSDLYNVYGPTECTCICSSYKITESDFESLNGLPPLGRIADNFSYLILGDDDRRVTQGEAGELCLLGPNVGKGYYNDHERTSASFVQNPYNNKFTELMYRTGDLVRLDPNDGKLYVQGRKDNQIKHMGYRIELEEIEAALHCLDYVSEAAALHTSSVNGLSRLVAVLASPEALDSERIRRDLGQIIPSYMIPSVFHRLDVLPKNPNGKVDRRRLAEQYLQTK